MEGSGSRDIANYYLGSEMPPSRNAQTVQQPTATDPLDHLASRPGPGKLNSLSNVFSAGLGAGSLNLSAEEQSQMMKSIQEIFELEEEQPREDEEMADVDEDVEEEVDLEDQQRRTERLKGVLGTLAQLWWSDSEHMDLVAEKLADGSRDRKFGPLSWRFRDHPLSFLFLSHRSASNFLSRSYVFQASY